DDFAKIRLIDKTSRLLGTKPLAHTLFHFRPFLGLPLHLEGKDMHLTAPGQAAWLFLVVEIASDLAFADHTLDAGLFSGLARGGIVKRLLAFRPSLGQDPATGS